MSVRPPCAGNLPGLGSERPAVSKGATLCKQSWALLSLCPSRYLPGLLAVPLHLLLGPHTLPPAMGDSGSLVPPVPLLRDGCLPPTPILQHTPPAACPTLSPGHCPCTLFSLTPPPLYELRTVGMRLGECQPRSLLSTTSALTW